MDAEDLKRCPRCDVPLTGIVCGRDPYDDQLYCYNCWRERDMERQGFSGRRPVPSLGARLRAWICGGRR
jgi:hypothetical protein